MLKRVKIQGYKSLVDVDVTLQPLTVLFGPNAAGKSNFLDALYLLSRIATSRRLGNAFEPPYRGNPLESFTFSAEGIKGLLQQERASFSITIEVELSPRDIESANRTVHSLIEHGEYVPLREKYLRFQLELTIQPKSGKISLTHELIEERTKDGQYVSGFTSTGEKSMVAPSFPNIPSPQIIAMQKELETWAFFCFEPGERMREPSPVREVHRPGSKGENLGAFLNTLKFVNPDQFHAIEKALSTLIPSITGIEVWINNAGLIELGILEGSTLIPMDIVSDGTLRILGLLAIASIQHPPALIGFEEPENGVQPIRISPIADILKTRVMFKETQLIVTTHSPLLPDFIPEDSLYVCRKTNHHTEIEPISKWHISGEMSETEMTQDEDEYALSISERILRGDFDVYD